MRDNQDEYQDEDQNQDQDQKQKPKEPIHKWLITFYQDGEDTRVKNFTGTFCEAWEISLPHPDDDRHVLWKHNVKAKFDAKALYVRVSWDIEYWYKTYTTIEKLYLLP